METFLNILDLVAPFLVFFVIYYLARKQSRDFLEEFSRLNGRIIMLENMVRNRKHWQRDLRADIQCMESRIKALETKLKNIGE